MGCKARQALKVHKSSGSSNRHQQRQALVRKAAANAQQACKPTGLSPAALHTLLAHRRDGRTVVQAQPLQTCAQQALVQALPAGVSKSLMAPTYDLVVCLFSHLVDVSREGDGMLLLLLPPCCAVLQHPLLNIPGIRPCEAGPRPAHGSWSGLGLRCLPAWLLQQSAGLHHLSTSLDHSHQVQAAARLSDSCSVYHVEITHRH